MLFGRGLFWPFVPRLGQPEPTRTGLWARVGRTVTRRPVPVVAASLAVLALLAAGGTEVRVGLPQTDQFKVDAESVDGQQTLARYFPAGAGRMRSAVGLPDTPGLLVTDVTAGSPAAMARLQPGDLRVELDGAPLLSCVTFAERAAHPAPLRLTVLRGETSIHLSLDRTRS